MPFTVLIPQPSSLLVRIHRPHGLDWKEANSPGYLFLWHLLWQYSCTSLCGNRVLPSQELSCLVTFRKTPTCACDWGSAAHALSLCSVEKDWTPASQVKTAEQSRQVLHEGIGNQNSLLDKQEHPSLLHKPLLHQLKFLKVKRGENTFLSKCFEIKTNTLHFNNFEAPVSLEKALPLSCK